MNNQRGLAPVVIVLIIVVLLAGGVLIWQYFEASEEITSWKTYKNEDFGFEIKYPSNLREEWKNPEEIFTLHEAWGEQTGKRLLLFSMIDSGKVYGFGFSVYLNPYNLTLEEFSQKLMDWMGLGCQLKTTEDILFGEEQISGVKFIFHNCNNDRIPDEIISQVLTKKNDNVIEIFGIGSLSNSEFIKRFNLMLSTFKFIEPLVEEPMNEGKVEEVEDETNDLKTYRNEEYGFEMKYPEDLLLYPPLKISPVEYISNNKKYLGIRLGEFNNGCSLNIFKTDRDENIDPFDETDIPVKMRQYAVSKELEFDDKIYHLGMSVASHAVDPDSCRSLLDQIVSTFQFLE